MAKLEFGEPVWVDEPHSVLEALAALDRLNDKFEIWVAK